jgi:hypothetical protein
MSITVNRRNDVPTTASIDQPDLRPPEASSTPVDATEEEALRIRNKLEQEHDPRSNEADDLAAALAGPKHGTA